MSCSDDPTAKVEPSLGDGRRFLGIVLRYAGILPATMIAAVSLVLLGVVSVHRAAAAEAKAHGDVPPATRLFNCDFNWARWPASPTLPKGKVRPSQPEDWADVDAQEYFDWHREFGNNVVYCQAYCSSGFALYPSKLGPVGQGKAARLFPDLYALARKAKMPVWSYYCVSTDLARSREHPEWIVPGSEAGSCGHGGFFGPETPHTELVCARLREFLKEYPVDWILLDWFVYGSLKPDEALVQPAEFVKQPFQEIIGRPMPAKAEDITPAEHLKYKRVVLERQFRVIKQAVRETSPHTKIIFNVPFHKADEALWRDHPMLAESDGLFAESSDEVVGWLLRVKKPGQRVMTTIVGRGEGVTDPGSWKKWYAKGCDFFGYAWATPPTFFPTAMYDEELKVVKAAFAEMQARDANQGGPP